MTLYEMQGLTEQEYNSIHKWLSRNKEKTGKCDVCKRTGIKTQYALIEGLLHERKSDNYTERCPSCHNLADVQYRKGTTVTLTVPLDEWNDFAQAIYLIATKVGIETGQPQLLKAS